MPFHISFLFVFSFSVAVFSQKNNFTSGVVFQEKINSDTTLSYQVYIPKSISEKNPPPILFIFDPMANSKRAIELFEHAAEECQTILICSDQNRNGPFEKNLKIFEALYADVIEKFDFDHDLQLLTGFSGGSRLATYLAVRKAKFAGVIACGAGLPVDEKYQPSVISKFGYYGIVGRRDMNYAEMLEVENFMQEKKIDHCFSFTNDAHIWPPSDVLTHALTWHLARKGQKDNSPSAASDVFLKNAQTILNQKYEQGRFLEYQNLKTSLENVFPDMEGKVIFQNIDTQILEEKRKERDNIIAEEETIIGDYYEEFQRGFYFSPKAKPMEWWGAEFAKWSNIETDSFSYIYFQSARIKNFISGYAHQSFYKYAAAEDFKKAQWFADLIFEISELKAYGYFMQAQLKAMEKDYKGAEKKLELAVKYGLDKKSYLLQTPAFLPMYERKGFKKILGGLE